MYPICTLYIMYKLVYKLLVLPFYTKLSIFAQTHRKLVQYLCWYIRACIDHSHHNEFEFECVLYIGSDWYTTACKRCIELLVLSVPPLVLYTLVQCIYVLSNCYQYLVGNAPCIYSEQSFALMLVLVRTISDTSAGNQFV